MAFTSATGGGSIACTSAPLVTIPQGKIGYVYARDGEPLPAGQTLGSVVPCNHFQDASAFLDGDGKSTRRGPARSATGHPARRRVRDQPRRVRRDHRERRVHISPDC